MTDHVTASDQGALPDASAASDPDAKMVLRTVYLPPKVDDELRVRAFHLNQTKNDLIREAVTRWLSAEGAAKTSAPAKTKAARRASPGRRAASRKTTSRKA